MKKLLTLTKVLKIIVPILLAFVIFSAGYLFGHRNLIIDQNLKPKLVNIELAKPKTVDFSSFWQAWDQISQKFIGTADEQKMIYGAIAGMTDSLDDPYSVFMDPENTKSFNEDLSGEFDGIGAELSAADGKLTVVTPLTGSPAEKAGLKPNDEILMIDEVQADSLTFYDAIGHIRGKAGTKVKLTCLREGWTEPQIIEIQRSKITVKSVEWKMKTDNIGYIKMTQFGDDTDALMQKALKEIMNNNPKGIVLDLRRNPGGYLQSAVETVGLFTPKGTVVVKEKTKDGKVQEEKTTNEPVAANVKLIVLIDKGSASAAEIVAGALQDLSRATLVGQKSFGKGSVQAMMGLDKGASLKLTIAEWLTPKNRVINHLGIEPDVKIELNEVDAKAGKDAQLDKALELAK